HLVGVAERRDARERLDRDRHHAEVRAGTRVRRTRGRWLLLLLVVRACGIAAAREQREGEEGGQAEGCSGCDHGGCREWGGTVPMVPCVRPLREKILMAAPPARPGGGGWGYGPGIARIGA